MSLIEIGHVAKHERRRSAESASSASRYADQRENSADSNEHAVREELRAMSRRGIPWDARLWCQLRDKLWEAGQLSLLPVLLEGVDRSTRQALECGEYDMKSRMPVDLAEHRRGVGSAPCWIGSANAPRPKAKPDISDPKMIMFVAEDELDLGSRLYHEGCCATARRRVVISAEVSQFTRDGQSIDLRPGVKTVESSFLLRSDFREISARSSQLLSQNGGLSSHLQATNNPFVMLLPSVTVFRGCAEDGFPFYQNPAHLDVIVTARSFGETVKIAEARDRTEYFDSEVHFTALVDRLSLIALAAIGQQSEDDNFREQAMPTLVLGLQAAKYPRHSLAVALQQWRQTYAAYFSQVLVTCGCGSAGEELANVLSEMVNSDACPSNFVDQGYSSGSREPHRHQPSRLSAAEEEASGLRNPSARPLSANSRVTAVSRTSFGTTPAMCRLQALYEDRHESLKERRQSANAALEPGFVFTASGLDKRHRPSTAGGGSSGSSNTEQLRNLTRELLLKKRGSVEAIDLGKKLEKLRAAALCAGGNDDSDDKLAKPPPGNRGVKALRFRRLVASTPVESPHAVHPPLSRVATCDAAAAIEQAMAPLIQSARN